MILLRSDEPLCAFLPLLLALLTTVALFAAEWLVALVSQRVSVSSVPQPSPKERPDESSPPRPAA